MIQRFSLPRPISVNAMFANAPGRGRVKTREYHDWRIEAGWAVRLAKPQPMRGAIRLHLTVTDDWRGDLDNCIKCACDVLQEIGVIANDRQIKMIFAQFGPVSGMDLEIENLP